MQDNTIYAFGPFLLDAIQRVLLRGTDPLRLMPKDVDVLIALVERHGEVVDKSWIFDRVWRGVCVEDCNLSQHVATLRRVLGDDAHDPKFIETVPRRGYRFVAPVARASRPSVETAALPSVPPRLGLVPVTPAPGALAPAPGALAPQAGVATAAASVPTAPPSALAPAPIAVTPAPVRFTLGPSESTPAPSGAAPTPVTFSPAPGAPAPTSAALALAPDTSTPAPFTPASFTAAPLTPALASASAPRRTWVARRGPAGLLALTALGLGWGISHPHSCAPAPAIRSVGVLPFANLTGDTHLDDVAAALTASLTSDLSGVRGLRVEGANPPGKEPHEVEGVDAIVETALLGGENHMRLAAELLDARTGRLLWAEMFDSDPVSWPAAAKRVAQAIAARLDTAVEDGRGSRASRAVAQREYALAREYLRRRTPQVVAEALEHFMAAARLDPGFALAQAGVAEAYLLGAEQRVLAPAEAHAAAESAARRALDLEPGLAQARAALGAVAAARWDFEGAEESYRRALSLDPALARVHERYAALLTVQDRHEEAIAEARVARDLEPTCPAAAAGLAAAYYHAGRHDEAIERALAALRMTPRFAAAYDVLGWAHQAKGHDAEAVAAFGEAVRLSGRNPTYVAALARAHARAGARKEAHNLLSELEQSRRDRAVSPLDLAEVLAGLGEIEQALRQVERAVAEGVPWLPRVDAGLGLEALHDQAGFRDLVGKMRRATALARGAGRPQAFPDEVGRGVSARPTLSAVSAAAPAAAAENLSVSPLSREAEAAGKTPERK